MNVPTRDHLRIALLRAFKQLLKNDGRLFGARIEEDANYNARKLHEVCINHKLAEHIQEHVCPLFSEQNIRMFVDIEFNREGTNSKLVKLGSNEKLVRPDIIVHNREDGEDKINFLVVECKKCPADKQQIEEDRQKLGALMIDRKYEYTYGLQVFYGESSIAAILFYKENEVINEEQINSDLKD